MLAAALACLSVVLPGCAATGVPADRAFQAPGPYPVGVVTLDLGSAGSFGDRLATVFYPANAAAVAGHPRFTYREADPLPAALQAIVPARYDTTISTAAHVGVPGSPHGPFPLVLFSHGFGASRLYYSHLLVGIASWGFVVVSADYLERGLVAEAENKATGGDTTAMDTSVMLASLSSAEAASADRGSVLHHLVDAHAVAAVGHSAGGGTAFDVLRDARVATAVGWAPVPPVGAPARKPVVIIGGLDDVALTPAVLGREYRSFPGPTSLVEVGAAGHDTFTDICPQIRAGGGLVGFAMSLHLVSADLAKLAVNGCQSANLTTERFWPVVQYYTLLGLRQGLHIDHGTVGVVAPPAGLFPGVHVEVEHRH